MHSARATAAEDLRFDLPPCFVVTERRLAGQAVERWLAGDGARVGGFDANALVVADPAGLGILLSVGAAVTATFGLAAGMMLDGRGGLAAEVRAACDLIAIDPRPVPFEASLAAAQRACILVRGVALPIRAAPGSAEQVQVIVSWREVLDRGATTRLRRELTTALRRVAPAGPVRDPFAPLRPD